MLKVVGRSDDDPPIFALKLAGVTSEAELEDWLSENAEVSAIRVHLVSGASLSDEALDVLSRRHDVQISVADEGMGEATVSAET